MAAKMKLCRCLSKPAKKMSILWVFIVLNNVLNVQTATQPPATTVAATNATTTTTTVTTTTVPTTTTLPPTTTIVPGVPRTVIGETAIGQCLCDLTGNECDINCCCDLDCTDGDKQAFLCDQRSVVIDDKLCYQEQIFPFTNSPATAKKEDGGLFCIYFDNYNARNYYLDPDFIQDIPSFNSYVNSYASPSIQGPVAMQEPVFTLNSFYKSGDPVYIVYPNQSRGTFVMPTVTRSNQCNDQNTIAYLNEVNTECSRIISLTANTCTTTAALNAHSYYQGFRVVKTPGLFGYIVNGTFVGITTTTVRPPTTTAAATTPTTASNTTGNVTTSATTPTTTTASTTTAAPTTVNPALIQTLYNNPYTLAVNATTLTHLCVQANGAIQDCNFASIPAPTFTAVTTTCNNVVQEVRYFITTDGTNGIAEVQVQFVFRSIQAANLPLTQRFSVTYNSLSDSNDTLTRSGNPGYLIGKPILYGTLVVNQTKEIELITDPALGLSVVRASATGDCLTSAASRVPIKFGENMRTGCLIRLNLTSLNEQTCASIQQAIVNTLEGPNTPSANNNSQWIDNNRYVGTFGNTGRLKVGDWVKVIVDNRPPPNSAQFNVDTCRLRMGLHIQFLYAYVGALANPQAKIVGVALLYDNVQNVKFRCVGAFCQAGVGNIQAFEVSQTVSFVDVSQPAVKFAGEAPIFIARVPKDFFYPFLYYSSDCTAMIYSQQTAKMLSIAVGTLFINFRLFLL